MDFFSIMSAYMSSSKNARGRSTSRSASENHVSGTPGTASNNTGSFEVLENAVASSEKSRRHTSRDPSTGRFVVTSQQANSTVLQDLATVRELVRKSSRAGSRASSVHSLQSIPEDAARTQRDPLSSKFFIGSPKREKASASDVESDFGGDAGFMSDDHVAGILQDLDDGLAAANSLLQSDNIPGGASSQDATAAYTNEPTVDTKFIETRSVVVSPNWLRFEVLEYLT